MVCFSKIFLRFIKENIQNRLKNSIVLQFTTFIANE